MDYASTISPVRTVIPLSNIKLIEESSNRRPASSPGSVRLYEQAKILEVSLLIFFVFSRGSQSVVSVH